MTPAVVGGRRSVGEVRWGGNLAWTDTECRCSSLHGRPTDSWPADKAAVRSALYSSRSLTHITPLLTAEKVKPKSWDCFSLDRPFDVAFYAFSAVSARQNGIQSELKPLSCLTIRCMPSVLAKFCFRSVGHSFWRVLFYTKYRQEWWWSTAIMKKKKKKFIWLK